MSNVDKQAVHAVADLKAGYTLGHADVAILNELARIALASLEADPVAWRSLYYENHGLLTGSKNVLASWQKQGWKCEPLYTTPTAPVSVLDEVTAEDCPAFVKYDITEVDEAWARGFNARRAAMPQGADSNSLVVPDGWKLVPAEPTEQMIMAAGPNCPDAFDYLRTAYKDIIAAAPQQEV
ncbi:TPA: hypothetical protein N5O29_000724 [Enterobacter kobei]|uniref:hypothetical protein n=1 Tax=Enterobacter kobei TaxID=208224 RepID=UPI002074E35B|nr:hypothetical protein [Enterobacter kobei]MCM7061998.1 hypothetical protein [Enterobacter kobei]HCM9731115.1 hypothetical protein [Enterobacter kobei]HDC4287981.1 hypothetical protein [Enterobacter kobei]